MPREHYRIPPSPSEGPYLVGGECTSCHTIVFPRKTACPLCGKDGTIIEKPLSRTGRVYSFSYCTVGPPGVIAPYIIGLVDLSEGPRIASIIPLENPSPASLKKGDEVELVIGKTGVDEQGRSIVNYMFRPVEGHDKECSRTE